MPTDVEGSQGPGDGPHQCITLVTDSGTGEKLCVLCGKTVESKSGTTAKILVDEKLDALGAQSSFTATLMPRTRRLVSDDDLRVRSDIPALGDASVKFDGHGANAKLGRKVRASGPL